MSDGMSDRSGPAPVMSTEACRVLGSLMEKELTVPASYPMTLNGLVTACNQSSGRNPVMALTESEVTTALDELRGMKLTRVVHASHGARTTKYRQVAHEVLALEPPERAVLTLLLLRGDQTPGELRTRSERLHQFSTVDDVTAALAGLAERTPSLVAEQPRRPGQKESRWRHLMAPHGSDVAAAPDPAEPSNLVAAPAQAAALPADLHPAAEPLRALIGRWEGAGAGEYPTIEGFAYAQVIEVGSVPGKPVLSYRSTTRHAESGMALHAESGWLRPVDGGGVELVVAQASGLVEVADGVLEAGSGGAPGGGEIFLVSSVAGTPTAKEVTATERRYRFDGDRLEYDIAMAAVGHPLTHHLRAALRRVH